MHGRCIGCSAPVISLLSATRIPDVQEFRSIRGEDPGADGLSQEDQDSLDLTKLLSALQTGERARTGCRAGLGSFSMCKHQQGAVPSLALSDRPLRDPRTAEQPGSLARALDGGAAQLQQNGVSSPTAEIARARRMDSKSSRHSFFGEAVGQPVLNLASFDIGTLPACLPGCCACQLPPAMSLHKHVH